MHLINTFVLSHCSISDLYDINLTFWVKEPVQTLKFPTPFWTTNNLSVQTRNFGSMETWSSIASLKLENSKQKILYQGNQASQDRWKMLNAPHS